MNSKPAEPYESPRIKEVDKPSPRRWGRHCLLSLGLAMASLPIILLSGYLQPFGYLATGPSTPERRLFASFISGLLLIFYCSLMHAFVTGVAWLATRRSK